MCLYSLLLLPCLCFFSLKFNFSISPLKLFSRSTVFCILPNLMISFVSSHLIQALLSIYLLIMSSILKHVLFRVGTKTIPVFLLTPWPPLGPLCRFIFANHLNLKYPRTQYLNFSVYTHYFANITQSHGLKYHLHSGDCQDYICISDFSYEFKIPIFNCLLNSSICIQRRPHRPNTAKTKLLILENSLPS